MFEDNLAERKEREENLESDREKTPQRIFGAFKGLRTWLFGWILQSGTDAFGYHSVPGLVYFRA